MTSHSATSSHGGTRCEPITAQTLLLQCRHGLIDDYSVPISTVCTKWNKGNVYNTPIAKHIWRGTWVYNVICQHPECMATQTWSNRMNYRSFKTSHWKRTHPNATTIKLKVVSFWKTEEIGSDQIKRITEHRLVSKDTLDYIAPIHPPPNASVYDQVDDIEMQDISVMAFNSNSNQDESANVHRDLLDTHDGSSSDHDDAHSNILDTNEADNSSAIDANEDIDVSTNNSRKRTLHALHNHPNPDHKRRRQSQHSGDSVYDMVMIPRELLKQMTDMVSEMKQVAIDLRAVEQGLKETRTQMQETNDHYEEMRIAFDEQRKTKQCTHCMDDNDECQSFLKNEMDLNRSKMQSTNLEQFVSKEGQTVWRLSQMNDGSEDWLLQCKLCESCADILNDTAEAMDDNIQNIQEINRNKKRTFGEGQIISSEQRIDVQFFKQKYKTMKKHIKTNKKHLAILTVFNDNMKACSSNIRVKSEVAFQLFTRSEPDILFHKIMTLLHRYNE